jgi:NAD(P)-dependent dehydrogenase (short-subunit alcohol dehydrogenase family)
VKGTLFTVQKALPLMSEGGLIVINGSMAAVKGIPAFGVYAASKAALRSFARTWSVDLRDRRIRVNIIAPGTVVTPAYKSFMTDEQIEGFTAQVAATTPLGRASAPRMRLPGRWSSSRTQRWMTVTSDGVNRGFSMKRSSPAE